MLLRLIACKLAYRFKLQRAKRVKECAEKARAALREDFSCAAKVYSLTALLFSTASAAALAQPSTNVLNKVFRPFEEIISLLVALVFGAGIFGFVILLVDALISWITGGSFGRSLAVSKLLRAVETLAVFPLTFFLLNVLKELGVPEVATIADIANALLTRGWQLMLEVLRGSG
ncbi:MAG: hypothetical protein QXQ60_01335 [Thermofilum sp.]